MGTIVRPSGNTEIVGDYDAASDVFYLSAGPAVASDSEDDPSGIILRWSLESGEPSGATIVGFRRYGWRQRLPQLLAVVRGHLHAPEHEMRAAIERAIPPTAPA
jgi:hypothetical protein